MKTIICLSISALALTPYSTQISTDLVMNNRSFVGEDKPTQLKYLTCKYQYRPGT